MLNERKLNEKEIKARKSAIKGLKRNKSALVKKYGADAEKVMYGIATKQAKKKVEETNKEYLKELIKKHLQVKETKQYGVWDVIGDNLETITSNLQNLSKTTTDPKWQKALVTISNQFDSLEEKIGKYDSKLGYIPTEEFHDGDRDFDNLNEDEIEEYYMGDEGDELMISRSGRHMSGEGYYYVLEKPDGSAQVDMTFDSEEEAKKYAAKRNLKISSQKGYNMKEQEYHKDIEVQADEDEEYQKLKKDTSKEDSFPNIKKWWEAEPSKLMSAIYHSKRQLPPTDKAKYDEQWKLIKKQLQKLYPEPVKEEETKNQKYLRFLTQYKNANAITRKKLKPVLLKVAKQNGIELQLDEKSKGDSEIDSLKSQSKKYNKKDSRYKQIMSKVGDLESDKDYALPGSQAAKKFDLDEVGRNDPVLMKLRALKDKKSKIQPSTPKPKRVKKDNSFKIKALEKEREQIMIDMEQEAEPEGGPIANRYGRALNKIDKDLNKLRGVDLSNLTYDQAKNLEEITPAQEKYRSKKSTQNPKGTRFRKQIDGAKKMIDAGKSIESVIKKYGQTVVNAVNAENEYLEEDIFDSAKRLGRENTPKYPKTFRSDGYIQHNGQHIIPGVYVFNKEYKGKGLYQNPHKKLVVSLSHEDLNDLQDDIYIMSEKKSLKEFTIDGGNYKSSFQHNQPKEKPGDMFDQKYVENLLPNGWKSRGTFEDRRKKHLEWTKERFNPTFTHYQSHFFMDGEIEYRIHQIQYYNHHYNDYQNPSYTGITVGEWNGTKNLGTYLMDSKSYLKDLKNLEVYKEPKTEMKR